MRAPGPAGSLLHLQRTAGNQAVATLLATPQPQLQAQLRIGQPGDAFEREADRVADAVAGPAAPHCSLPGISQIHGDGGGALRRCARCGGDRGAGDSGGPPAAAAPGVVQRKCQCAPGKDDELMQRRETPAETPRVPAGFTAQLAGLRGSGAPLSPAQRAFFEPRFGHDFGAVRLHTGALAERSAEAVRARAFTLGNDIVFGRAEYAPDSPAGRHLLAHELTHVMQQTSGSPNRTVIQRQQAGHVSDAPHQEAQDATYIAGQGSRDIENRLKDTSEAIGQTWKAPPELRCGPDFCRPLPTKKEAVDDRRRWWPFLRRGIAVAVSSRVLPLWDDWANGGSKDVRDSTKDFGADFAASKTTKATTSFLITALKNKLAASPPTIPAAGYVSLDIPTLIPGQVKAIDTPGDTNMMDFTAGGGVPGNLAGGIGKDEAANPVGLTYSPQDDARIAKGRVTIMNAGSGKLLVIPHVSYTVKDTVDLCPGNCGSMLQKFATVPMSRWEATEISGDVPFTVDFAASSPDFYISLLGLPGTPAPSPAGNRGDKAPDPAADATQKEPAKQMKSHIMIQQGRPRQKKAADLGLVEPAASAAALLETNCPDVVFTSGRRDIAAQARGMTENILAGGREWIARTYVPSPPIAKLEAALGAVKPPQPAEIIEKVLLACMQGMSPKELTHVSKHLGGLAFDVKPVGGSRGEEIIAAMKALPGTGLVLTKEGGLTRFHWQASLS